MSRSTRHRGREEGVLRVAEAVQESVGIGVKALSQWEGFG